MTTKVRALILVSLAMVGITVVSITHTQAPRESDQAEVMALNQRLIAAYNSKDVSAIMAFYSDDPNAIFFEEHHPPSALLLKGHRGRRPRILNF